MISFEHVSAAYTAETPILNDVSFTIEDGEFIAFVGTNGAGKSTTMRLINGLLKPTAGQVLIDGPPPTQLKTSELARRVGFLFQNPDRQICCNSVRDELEFGFKAQGALTDEARARVDAIIDEFGFDPDAEPYLLNRGTRQLLALASIIVMEPPVIVLDEPTTGLDFRECQKVMEIVAHLHREGKTIVMVCHDMEVVGDYAQRIVVMTRGELVAQGPTFQLLRNPEVLRRADLVPPQVVAISMALVARHPALTGPAGAHAHTLPALTAALQGIAEEKGALR
ncbi:MAG: ABC transporter ATP-binding protein [Coriobacteriales bacterium]|nr:ABC transporter ATP-binding protein [Coriobacteriales bacterium]